MRTSRIWKSKGLNIGPDDKLTESNFADYIFHMTEKDINYDFIMTTFGEFGGKNLAHTYDLLVVPAHTFSYKELDGKVKFNTNEFTTTVGLYLFNLILSSFDFSYLFNGYIADTIDKKAYGKIDKKLSHALIEDDIDAERFKKWQNYMQWFMPFEDVLAPNHTEKMITISKAINKKKDQLVKQYKEQIDNGDIAVVEQIEKELLAYAKEYMGDDEAMDTMLSGGGGSFGNNFKNMFVMKGAIRDPNPAAKQKYHIVTSSYIDGITADEYPAIAGAGTEGAYSRGKKTETGGYWEKLFISAFQHLKITDKDCGTNRTISVVLTEDNVDDWIYSYVVDNRGSLTLLDSKTIGKYIGKKVNLRFASMCEDKNGICPICAGKLLSIGVDNIGVSMSQIPSTLKLRCMKGFHDATVSTTKFDAMKAFYPFGK